MCCCCSVGTRSSSNPQRFVSHEKEIRAAVLCPRENPTLLDITRIALESFQQSSTAHFENREQLLSHLHTQPNGNKINFVICTGTQREIDLQSEIHSFVPIPVIPFTSETPNICTLGSVTDLIGILKKHFPKAERKDPETKFYPYPYPLAAGSALNRL